MRLLLTNDDGVYAPGLSALHAALAPLHEVIVVAPETEQSAVGHAITLADPIRVRRLGPRTGFDGWAVTGTPADCVKLAVSELLPQAPELVVSGINLGANVGVNLLYSGTVSAATEAAILGLPGVAFSLGTLKDPDFTYAARVAAHLVGLHPSLGMPSHVSLNVNVPALPAHKIKGIRFTRQSNARLVERFLRRSDPRGHIYYWQAGETMGTEGDLETDYPALRAGYVTVTPVRHDLTHEDMLAQLGVLGLDLPA
ncbi:MAG: 5'/3'-nucleotidase SurE [Desulfarculus sp.]|nr:5'/3'-nucleotidase SurE [Desulfarculus sp.]